MPALVLVCITNNICSCYLVYLVRLMQYGVFGVGEVELKGVD